MKGKRPRLEVSTEPGAEERLISTGPFSRSVALQRAAESYQRWASGEPSLST